MTEYITWIPPGNGESITFGLEAPYILLQRDGSLPTQGTPRLSQAPGQHGSTLIDTEVSSRVQALSIIIQGTNKQDLWAQRARLVRALVSLPIRPGESPELGTLRMYRPGFSLVELPAVPRMSPVEGNRYSDWMYADIEFECPYPFWRDLEDSNAELVGGFAGFIFPLEHPFEIVSGQSEVDIQNAGDVSVPVMIRIYGELTTPRIINLTTGEGIKISGTIGESQFLEIRTGFGDKAVELVRNDGSRVNWMGNIDLDNSDFWHLAVGNNRVQLDPDSNVSGTARIFWRQRYAGI